MTESTILAPEEMIHWARRCDDTLTNILPEDTDSELVSAMRYSCLAGGKRLRASLVYATGKMLGAPLEALDYPAAAVEMIHTYSLIHDDLPAMDDDDLRRGKATCHKVFGEAIAILAGDALQTLAFETLTNTKFTIDQDSQQQMIRQLSQASGVQGMVGGQAIDFKAVGRKLDLSALKAMHRMKTGALINASVKLGALCVKPIDHSVLNHLEDFSSAVGLAFQVVDDILDETMDTKMLGKDGGSDRQLNKPTYTTVLGLEKSREIANNLHQDALASLRSIRHNTSVLEDIAEFVLGRSY